MTERSFRIKMWTSFVSLFIILLPLSSWASPQEVTLFPDSARVVEVTKVRLQTEGKDLRKAVFVLPGQADPDSLVTRLPDGSKLKIEDQTWRQIVRQDDEKISELRKEIEKIKNYKRSVQATIQSLNTQIQFWQLQTKAKLKTLSDVHNMSAAIGKNMKKTYQDKLSQELELEKLDKQIRDLQDEFDRMAGKKETAWEVAVTFSGPKAAETMLTYTYSMSGCGWLPLYRLEAKPKAGRISFTWEAEIWQSSGNDWNQVVTNLATLKPLTSIAPSNLPPWVIKAREYRIRMEKKAAKAADYMESLNTAEEAVPAAAPQQLRQSTYAVWQIGRKSIPAGSRQKVKLQEERWTSEFSYLIRPSLSSQAFVRASIRLPEPKEIPSGSATFMIDGAILGKREFSLAGQEAQVFFGTDPMVTGERTLILKKSGEKGMITDKQTFAWDWRIDAQNLRDGSIRVIIEEPNPQTRDERIKMTLKHNPEPTEKTTSSLLWNLDVAAGQKRSILSSVSLEAPKDMLLDLGSQK